VKPARILFVNHVSRISGAERSLLDMLQHIDRSRFEPIVVLPTGGELTESLRQCGVRCLPLPLRRICKTTNPWRLAVSLLNVVKVTVQLTRLIRRERIALVHANSNTAQIYAGPAARLSGVPCIWHTRDLVNLGLLGPWLNRFSSRTIAISDCVHRHVSLCIHPPNILRTIYNGIDTTLNAPHGRSQISLPDEPVGPQTGSLLHKGPVFGMIAQLVPWKNHGAFIETAARLATILPDARFVIAGDDLFDEHRGYRTTLESKIAQLGLKDRLLFTGHLPDVTPLLESMDVVIHPAVREPLGRVILEAMARGKPVVAVNACGPAEIIRHGLDGLLAASERAEDLAEEALCLIHNPLLAGQLGAAGRQRVEQDFNIRNKIREIEALYDELLSYRSKRCV
jgi:glycosyltransferase involved in cell wall biosynthesis